MAVYMPFLINRVNDYCLNFSNFVFGKSNGCDKELNKYKISD